MPNLEDMMDAALGDALSAGWDDDPAPVPPVEQHKVAAPFYPPLPMKEPVKRAKKQPQVAAPSSTEIVDPAPPVDQGIPSSEDEDDTDDEEAPGGVLNIGVLTDLAMGRKTPEQAANALGMPTTDLQTALATTLRESSPDDIAKALAIQASEQQLKSGAIYGAVLFDLLKDMSQGRMQPKEKIKFAELVAAVGRVMPKEAKDTNAGGGFVLNINLGQSEPKTIVLDNS